MGIEKARNADVEIAYERFGPPEGMPLLWLNGAGAQMVMFWNDLCMALVERGFQVALMDTRDTGLSTHLTRYDVPRRHRPLRYTLRDITNDVIAVFDALGWSGAHVAGMSEGGTIAQAVATYHPDRARSLTSVSSTPTTSLRVNRPKVLTNLRLFKVMSRKSADRDAEGQKWVNLFRLVGSPDYALDEQHWREAGRLAYDRGLNPAGDLRIAAALYAAGDRRRELTGVQAPTLVIHGEADPMCSPRAGRATAEAIPDARFVSYPGMGHDLPRELWPAILDEITALATRADTQTTRSTTDQEHRNNDAHGPRSQEQIL
jgi:pimeloyl-ACP methyl ester carboxylesterase